MRIVELHLKAFGHFTDVRLDLSGGSEGLHLIYGPNEAGKSTSLRALKALLYGIPANTEDNFLHPNEALRVGGRLRSADGTELTVERRKGTRRTLLNPTTGRPVEDSTAARFLAGLERDVFDRRFGIDHDRLVAGGREILEGKGELGEMLFSAALGRAGLRSILRNLEREAAALFKADARTSGKDRVIVETAREFRTAWKKAEDAALEPERWVMHDAALRAAQAEREAVSRQAAEVSARINRLERLRQAIAPASARRARATELATLGTATVLRPNFAEDRRAAMRTLEQAVAAVRAAEADLNACEKEIAAVRLPEEILSHEALIEDVYQRIGEYRRESTELEEVRGRQVKCEGETAAALEQLGRRIPPGELEKLRITPAQRMYIQDMATRRQALLEKLEAKRQDRKRHEADLEAARADLAGMPPARSIADLADAVERTRREGDLDHELAAVTEALGKQEQQAQFQLSRFPHWKGDLEKIGKLALPAPETIDRFDADFNTLQTRLQIHISEIRLLKQRLEVVGVRAAALESAGETAAPSDLASLRKRRERGWKMVKEMWLEKKGDVSPSALAAAFEKVMADADEAADRTARDAGRVARLAELQTAAERLTQEIELRRAARDQVEKDQARLKERWEALWRPIGLEPLTPAEMRAWMQQHQSLCRLIESMHESRRRLEAVRKKIADHRAELTACLERAGEPRIRCEAVGRLPRLDAVLDECRAVLRSAAAAAEARKEIETRIALLEAGLPTDRAAEDALAEEWNGRQSEWAAATAMLGLGEDVTPPQVGSLLAKLDDLFARLDEAGRCRQRVAALEAETGEFTAEVGRLVERTAPELKGVGVEQAVTELHDRLKKALGDRTRLVQLRRLSEEKTQLLRRARETVEQENARLTALCREAGAADVNELETIENRSEKIRTLRTDIEQIDRQLTAFCPEGEDPEEFTAEAEALAPDAVPGDLSRLADELRALEQRRTALDKVIGKENAELAKMDGNSRALPAAEKAEALRARTQAAIERHLRLHLASLVLRRRIDEYRAENQTKLLGRAGELFGRMTLGSFAGIAADRDAKENPVLVGVRAGGQRVPVEGMSEGTRDQLYLALRLAGLEKHLAANEPVPFVLDDILINFDDQRSAATLSILGELSNKTQVVYFTHHEHLLEVARKAVPEDVLRISALPGR